MSTDRMRRDWMRAAPFPLFAALAACQAAREASVPQGGDARRPLPTYAAPPALPRPEACWAVERRAAVVETVEETVLVEPPGLGINGTLRTEPLTRIESRQEVTRPASEVWFEELCPAEVTPERIASLQRALAVRGLYSGAVTGRFDGPTGEAVRAYQAPLGLDSATLSRAAAERLGLVVTPLPANGIGAGRPE